MWSGFDPELRRQLDYVRQMVALRQQTPSREWPLVFFNEQKELLVVREWPNGSVTAYILTDRTDSAAGSPSQVPPR
jgi:hypothetical protein